MTSLFSKPKAPDTSAQEKQMKLQEQEAEERRLEEERKLEQSQIRRRRGQLGRRSLISGSETGTASTTTG